MLEVYFRERRKGEVRRISIPRTPVNKGAKDKKGPGMITQILASPKTHQVGLRKLQKPKARARCYSAYPQTVTLQNTHPAESVLYLAGEPPRERMGIVSG
jgi:hypothetical protein